MKCHQEFLYLYSSLLLPISIIYHGIPGAAPMQLAAGQGHSMQEVWREERWERFKDRVECSNREQL